MILRWFHKSGLDEKKVSSEMTAEKPFSYTMRNDLNLSKKAIDTLDRVYRCIGPEMTSDENIRTILDKIDAVVPHAGTLINLLERPIKARGICSWFIDGDLNASKNWFYTWGKLRYIGGQPPFKDLPQGYYGYGYGCGKINDVTFALVSDHPDLVRWIAEDERERSRNRPAKDTENPRMQEYWGKQFYLALRGAWDELGARSERILANPPKSGDGLFFLNDHHFYVALARGDADGMRAAIRTLFNKKGLPRLGREFGFTEHLLSTYAVLYAKLAWRHGYELSFGDSPYLPEAWLPVRPLDAYVDPFPFMERYDFPASEKAGDLP
ncbi:Imm49 family immunity protein [Sphingomonas morindae]|uniref:Immunity 49 family protein n=1 Tax=Sphingomonas morindae TaxID=1541170 RepID=A0ABY4X9A2_9SPHN|nr:Imm49 family immunity protein [Sphingomonas morindae]USI73479.1 immunity 49 family protein [Sphingomonas morindae]